MSVGGISVALWNLLAAVAVRSAAGTPSLSR